MEAVTTHLLFMEQDLKEQQHFLKMPGSQLSSSGGCCNYSKFLMFISSDHFIHNHQCTQSPSTSPEKPGYPSKLQAEQHYAQQSLANYPSRPQEALNETALSLLACHQSIAGDSRQLMSRAFPLFLALHHRGYVLSFITCILSSLIQRKSWCILRANIKVCTSKYVTTEFFCKGSPGNQQPPANIHRIHLFTTRADNAAHSFLGGNHSLADKLLNL